MNAVQQKRVQVLLCERALQVWEALVPNSFSYRETVAGTEQELDAQLPRDALAVVLSGCGGAELKARYLEPMTALQDDDLVLQEKAQYAFYAIHNLFVTHVLHKETDPWLVPNQALAAIGDESAVSALEWAIDASA